MTSSEISKQPNLNTSEISIMSVMSSEEKHTSERRLKLIVQNIRYCQPNPAKSSGLDLNYYGHWNQQDYSNKGLSTLQFDIPNEKYNCKSHFLIPPLFIFFHIWGKGGLGMSDVHKQHIFSLSLFPTPRKLRSDVCCPRNSLQSQPLSNATWFFGT